ncbi:MAG: hypothetical protein IKD53_03655 [Clostridia bacterium]|nr:hypothetical protein [Clostridia bacterium]
MAFYTPFAEETAEKGYFIEVERFGEPSADTGEGFPLLSDQKRRSLRRLRAGSGIAFRSILLSILHCVRIFRASFCAVYARRLRSRSYASAEKACGIGVLKRDQPPIFAY